MNKSLTRIPLQPVVLPMKIDSEKFIPIVLNTLWDECIVRTDEELAELELVLRRKMMQQSNDSEEQTERTLITG
jgi:acyl carrier protein phosphodiesterase